jgi:hypothetical protein
MKQNESERTKRGRSPILGCGCFMLLFPICISVFSWFAFAIGPMNCALPNRCSPAENNAKGIVSIIFLIGGGFLIPTTVAIAVAQVGEKSK